MIQFRKGKHIVQVVAFHSAALLSRNRILAAVKALSPRHTGGHYDEGAL